jgi:ABC-type phosphate transport system substrate-binding protein
MRPTLRRWATTAARMCVLSVVLGSAVMPAQPAAASPAIHGGGSGFAALEVAQWSADAAGPPLHLNVDYTSQGSSIGRQNFANGLYDYGMSDITYPPIDRDIVNGQTRCPHAVFATCFRYVPVSAGGLGIVYNLVNNDGSRVTDLQLTRQQVCQIFTGAITDWGQIRPAFAGHHINVIVRSDGAGESYVLSQFCIGVDPTDWNAYRTDLLSHHSDQVQDAGLQLGQPVSTWPQVLIGGSSTKTGSGSDGVANVVADSNAGKDGVTYDAAGYAKVRFMPVASVQNAAGVFQQPDENNVTIALAYARPNPDPNAPGTFLLNFSGPDPRAYFPSTYSYALAQTTGFDPGKGATLGQFLCYAISDQGQRIAPALRYARLSNEIVTISRSAIVQIPGAPAPGACAPGSQGIPTPTVTPNGLVVLAGSATANRGTSGTAASSSRAGTASTAATTGSTAGTESAGAATTTSSLSGTSGDQQLADSVNQAALKSQAANSKKNNGPSNEQALWAILEGALICALAVAFTGWRRRATG